MLNSVIALSVVLNICTYVNSSPLLDGRIVGGNAIGISKTPYIVSVQANGGHLCGGSLISDQWVLSASHCFQDIHGADMKVRVGSSFYDQGGKLIDAKYIIKHEDYDNTNLANDIALIKLSEKVNISDSVQIIPLTLKQEASGTRAYLSGWGYTKENSRFIPKHLHGVEVAVISQEKCRHWYADLLDTKVCAYSFGKDSCQGDSGGPMVTNGKLNGIVSSGAGCGTYPGIYTSIPHFGKWIKDTMEKYT